MLYEIVEEIHRLKAKRLVVDSLSGLHQVLAERAAEPERRKIPVIIITANRGDDGATVLNGGIYALLPKPFNLGTLHALVKSCLGPA
jgi:DNA-binding response OmpR family regulator